FLLRLAGVTQARNRKKAFQVALKPIGELIPDVRLVALQEVARKDRRARDRPAPGVERQLPECGQPSVRGAAELAKCSAELFAKLLDKLSLLSQPIEEVTGRRRHRGSHQPEPLLHGLGPAGVTRRLLSLADHVAPRFPVAAIG